LSYPELQRDYLATGTPVILTDLAADWPALRRWTPDFFRERYGHRQVDTYDESFQQLGSGYLRPSGQKAFGDFIEEVLAGPTSTRLFLFDLFKLAPELRDDIRLPRWVDALSRRFLVTFFGGESGVTTFHHDVDLPHVFHVVLYGTKEFFLFGPEQTPHLHPHPWTVRSYVDLRAPDLVRHPRFRHAQGQRCWVSRGETLVIPSGHWHQVHYPGPSWGIAFRKYVPGRVPAALFNMIVQESVDRLLTATLGHHWWRYKEARSRNPSP
jgi:hypothetical protein